MHTLYSSKRFSSASRGVGPAAAAGTTEEDDDATGVSDCRAWVTGLGWGGGCEGDGIKDRYRNRTTGWRYNLVDKLSKFKAMGFYVYRARWQDNFLDEIHRSIICDF